MIALVVNSVGSILFLLFMPRGLLLLLLLLLLPSSVVQSVA